MLNMKWCLPCLNEGVFQRARMTLSSQSGFTLIELMIAITILGILTFISSGNLFSARSAEQVRSASETIRSVLTTARMKALSTGQKQYVGIDLNSSAIASTVYGDSFADAAWSPNTAWRTLEGVDLIESKFDGSLKSGVTKGVNIYSFTSRGTAESDGSVLIKPIKRSANESAASGKVIVVNQVTGRVRADDCTAACQ